MTRTAKTPRYDEFNRAENAYGSRAQDPKKWLQNLNKILPTNLELGCGKAEVTLELATRYPDENFIGIDLKADRLWRASKNAIEMKLNNVAFIQSNVLHINEFIPQHSVKMIWITHPDPFRKDRQAKHRMLNRNFLDVYKNALDKSIGTIRFKTDNSELYNWSVELLAQQKDIEILKNFNDLHSQTSDEDLTIITTYSKKFIEQGVAIKYLEFRFTD